MQAVVIGGGWAGIAAAIRAVTNGWQVTLVEERPYLGGRARSFVDKQTNVEIDNGQHVMMGAYAAAQYVMENLGTFHLLHKQQALRVAFADADGGTGDVLDASALPGKLGVAIGLLRLRGLRPASRILCLRLAVRLSGKRIAVHGLSCEQLLARENQPHDAIVRFWEPLVLATLNAPLHKAPASLLVNVMRLAFMGNRGASGLWIPTTGLSNLVNSLPEWLMQRNGRIHLSTGAVSMNREGNRVHSVKLTNGDVLQVDAVVCAVPQRSLERLLAESDVAAELPPRSEYSPIISVYLWYDVQWLDTDFTAALGTTVQWVFNKQRIHPGLVALTVSAASAEVAESAEAIVERCDAELRRLFPARSRAQRLHAQVIKEKLATPLITPELEQERQRYWGSGMLQPYDREARFGATNIAVAGDWTVPGLPATIEAAARSGIRAADEVCSRTDV